MNKAKIDSITPQKPTIVRGDEWDTETYEPIVIPARLYDLGNTGEYNFIASIHSAEVTGGVDAEEVEMETSAVKKLTTGVFRK